MSPDFSAVHHKVNRAREHAEHLKREIDAYLRNEPSLAAAAKVKPDPKTGKLIASWAGGSKTTCPPEWSVILGEFFHNLRSSLDFVAWITVEQLAPDKLSRNVGFPIFGTKDDFERSFSTKLPGVRRNSGFGAAFESVQPYNIRTENPYVESVLWLIQRLNNIDKHCLLHVMTDHVSSVNFSFSAQEGDPPAPVERLLSQGVPLQEDTMLAELPFGADDLNSRVTMHGELEVYVGFGETSAMKVHDKRAIVGTPVTRALDICIDYMDSQILPWFPELFSFSVELTPRHDSPRSADEEE